MSLKAFHIFFIAISTLMTFGFAFWLVEQYATSGEAVTLGGAVVAAILGIGLIVYARRFLRKLRHVSYL